MSRIKRTVGVAGGAAMLAVAVVGTSEGLRTKAYQDIVGVWTVCYGETLNVRRGQTYTKSQCDEMFVRRLDEFGDAIEKCVPSLKTVGEKRYVAHLSLAYNIGQAGYCRSTAARLQNSGRELEACDAFLMWNKPSALMRRRNEERALCREGGVVAQIPAAKPSPSAKAAPLPRPAPARAQPETGFWAWLKGLFS